MLKSSIMEAIYLIERLMERRQEKDKKRDLHMVLVDLVKAYDRFLRETMWWVWEKKQVSSSVIDVIKGMHDGAIIRMRKIGG